MKNYKKMERMNNTFWKIMFTAFLVFPFIATHAQTYSERDAISNKIKRMNIDRNLVADKVEVKMETAAIDSIRMQYELDDEEDDISPAEELYEGNWNNQYVKTYAGVVVPDYFQIDLSSFVMPVKGKITSPFGHRRRRFHYGTDIKLHAGDTVYAAFEGKVRVKQYERRGYGYFLVLRHPNGLETVYGHLSQFLVDEKESVEAGQPIALGGSTGRSTGSHLHFECRFVGQAINPAEIVDFENFCTFYDSYLFQKSKVHEVSIAVNKSTKSERSSDRSSPVKYHRIRSGDSLSKIAQLHRVSVTQLCRLNGLQRTSILKIGKVLRCA